MPKSDKRLIINERPVSGIETNYGAVVVNVTAQPEDTDPNDAIRPRGHHGVQYFGPTVYLAEDLAVDGPTIKVTAPLFVGDEAAWISSTAGYERVYLEGPPTVDGNGWTYPVTRGEEYTDPLTHLAGSEVISTGSPATGGHILIDSSKDSSSPFIEMRQNEEIRGETTWRLQLGRLTSVPDWFKAQFEDVPAADWDQFSLAANNIYLSGYIYATGGTIAGDLLVTGTIYVPYDDGRPMLEFGQTIDGAGMVMRDDQGAPRFMIVTPYVDEHGVEQPLAMVLAHRGQKGLYWHYEPTINDYVIELRNATVGPFEIVTTTTGPDPAERVASMTLVEGSTVFEDLAIPALQMSREGSADPDLSVLQDSARAFLFDKDTDQELFFAAVMPERRRLNSDLVAYVHWAPTDTDTGDVVWTVEYTWADVDGAFGSTGDASATDAGDGTAYNNQRASLGSIAGWGYGPGSCLICRVYRDADNGADTYDADAALLSISFRYEIDTLGATS